VLIHARKTIIMYTAHDRSTDWTATKARVSMRLLTLTGTKNVEYV